MPHPSGHNVVRSVGDTMYRETPPNLPRPNHHDHAAAVRGMREDGYCVFPNALDRERVAWLRAKIDGMGGPDERYEVAKWCFNKQLPTPYAADPEVLFLLELPGVNEVCEEVFAGHFHVIGGSLWVTGQGRGMGIHIDYLPFPLPPDVAARPDVTIPVFMATAHLYLDDLELELGPTTIVPGSHRAARHPENETSWNGVPPHAVMVRAGDVVLFRSDLWHGAAMNTSDRRRYMVQVHYGHGSVGKWFPPISEETLYSPEVLDAVTDRQRRLLSRPTLP